MKKKHFIPTLISVIIISLTNFPILAQDLSVDAGADFVSRYIWRGLNVNEQPNVQPYIIKPVNPINGDIHELTKDALFKRA